MLRLLWMASYKNYIVLSLIQMWDLLKLRWHLELKRTGVLATNQRWHFHWSENRNGVNLQLAFPKYGLPHTEDEHFRNNCENLSKEYIPIVKFILRVPRLLVCWKLVRDIEGQLHEKDLDTFQSKRKAIWIDMCWAFTHIWIMKKW